MRKITYKRIMLQRQTGPLWSEADTYEESNPGLRFRLLRKLVHQGHSDPGLLQSIAYAYAEGIGTRQSRLQAQRWNKKAWKRGSESAACNAGIDARLDGRQALAVIWFRRAIAAGSSDALLLLAKLLLPLANSREEVLSLLQQRVGRGPEYVVEITSNGEPKQIADEQLAEALRLLKEVASPSAR